MKSARWNLAVFSRKLGPVHHYSTLGLGRFNVEVKVKGPGQGAIALQRALQMKLGKASALEIASCRPAARAELRRVHLDLRFQQPEAFSLTGFAPLILERLLQPGGESREIAYSPLRPDDFFVVDSQGDLERQANLFFAAAWQGIAETEAAQLLRRGHERLLSLPVQVGWRALYEGEPEKAERIGALGRRREQVLGGLAMDVSSELAMDEEKLEALPVRPSRLEQRLLTLLAAERPPSLAFIGPAACGKSAQIEALAARLLCHYGFLEHGVKEGAMQVFRLQGRRLISGMSYVGQWEQRCLDLLEQCRELRKAGRRQARGLGRTRGAPPPIVLWVEDLAAWGQIGRSRESSRCLADVFLMPLRRGELLIFGEATPEGFALLEDDAPAFAALFGRIELRRPDAGQALSILLEQSRRLEEQGAAPLEPGALRVLIENTPMLYGEDAHPGFSCRLLEQAAEATLAPDGEEAGEAGPTIGSAELLALMAAESGLPPDLLRPSAPLEMAKLRAFFERRVLGQEEAVQAVCELILTLKAGLQNPRRPPAVLLFTGPTGTGKTELAKALAAWLYGDERRLLRFDMGEHADPFAVARLVGQRGRPEGLLTEAVRAQPFAVLLFDEIEKADAGVLHLLLQVFEDGRLTDALGQVADFRQCVLVLTSNLGARTKAKVGLRPDGEAVALEARQAVERFFAPELFNRIDRVVAFRPLTPEIVRRIAEIELYRVFSRRGLAERGVFVRSGDAVIERIGQLGFDERSGARGVRRFLEKEIVLALTEALVEVNPAAYLLLQLQALADGGFAVEVEAIEEAAALATDEAIDRLYELPPARLLEEIPDWLARLETLHHEHQAGLEREQSARLRSWQEGAPREGAAEAASEADALYDVDLLRGRLLELRRRLESELERRQPDEGEIREAEIGRFLGRRGTNRDFGGRRLLPRYDLRAVHSGALPIAGEAMLALASEILWLEYAAKSPGGGLSGRVVLELLLLSEHRPRKEGRAAHASPSLQEELASLLLEDALLLESFETEAPAGRGTTRQELAEQLAQTPRLLRLVVSGTLLAERLAGDTGSYVRVRGDGNQEIVRLEVLAFPPAEPSSAKKRALPLVQRIHFDAPPEGEWVRARVEDFALCLELERPVRRLPELLQPLRRRRQMAFLAGAGQ